MMRAPSTLPVQDTAPGFGFSCRMAEQLAIDLVGGWLDEVDFNTYADLRTRFFYPQTRGYVLGLAAILAHVLAQPGADYLPPGIGLRPEDASIAGASRCMADHIRRLLDTLEHKDRADAAERIQRGRAMAEQLVINRMSDEIGAGDFTDEVERIAAHLGEEDRGFMLGLAGLLGQILDDPESSYFLPEGIQNRAGAMIRRAEGVL